MAGHVAIALWPAIHLAAFTCSQKHYNFLELGEFQTCHVCNDNSNMSLSTYILIMPLEFIS